MYRAFTDPDELAEWYAPGEMTAEVHELEAEPDGRLSVSMVDDDERHEAEGSFSEVVENERLVHSWRWHGTDGPESRITVTFEDAGGATEVVLTHELLPDAESVERHLEGWSGVLENLAAVLET